MPQPIKAQFETEIANVTTSAHVESLRVKYLGKTGLITEEMKKLGSMPPEERKAFGAQVNAVRTDIANKIEELKATLESAELDSALQKESIDISLPSREASVGKIHPISHTISEIKDIFTGFGFTHEEGPDIEDDWHNFTALNIPENHPARQMHDTFYLEDGNVLRTHTSNAQIRVMQNKKPPFRFITIGRVFRSDSDATHSPMFHQLEIVYLDKKSNVAEMKYCIEEFLKKFFEIEQAPIRLRASHFPFTEPSAEVDVKCDRSVPGEIKIGQGEDWIEILGCGMIHPNVLKNCGIDPNEYQGFAVGAGIERLAMLKYGISDLRKFYDCDQRWLQHFGF